MTTNRLYKKMHAAGNLWHIQSQTPTRTQDTELINYKDDVQKDREMLEAILSCRTKATVQFKCRKPES